MLEIEFYDPATAIKNSFLVFCGLVRAEKKQHFQMQARKFLVEQRVYIKVS